MKKITLLLAGCPLLLSGCAGVKSSFDCDATTSDTCITMTKANQLARNKAAKQAGKPAAGGLPSLVNLPAPVHSMVTSPAANTHPVAQSATSSGQLQVSGPVAGRASRIAAPPAIAGPATTTSVTAIAPSCQSVRCDNPGTVYPQRSQDRIATVWIAPWVDSDNAFHQPGRVSFVVSPADWILPSRIN